MNRIEARISGREAAICSLAAMGVAFWVAACASGGGSSRTATNASPPPPPAMERSDARVLAIHLSSDQPSQVIPVIRRETTDRLLLSFDIAGDGRQFYTARFRPADHDWRVSHANEQGVLPPPDEITDYQTSADLDFPYVQYTYEFPNSRVEFYRSGNFVLEVVDDRGRILFARHFFVSDDLLEVTIGARSSSLITDRPDELIPEARVPLPNDPWFSPNDCSVSFFKNGWTDETFRSGIARIEGDDYIFEASDPFRLTVPVFSTDLTGNTGIHRRDPITVPETVTLLPDDMRFWGDDYRFSSPLPRRAGSPVPETRYVLTHFIVQDGPRDDAPFLVGTFNDWEASPAYQLAWRPEDATYEIVLPLREEPIFYTYAWREPDAVRPQSKFAGPESVVFTAVVYAKDARYPTDRVLAVRSQTLPEEER